MDAYVLAGCYLAIEFCTAPRPSVSLKGDSIKYVQCFASVARMVTLLFDGAIPTLPNPSRDDTIPPAARKVNKLQELTSGYNQPKQHYSAGGYLPPYPSMARAVRMSVPQELTTIRQRLVHTVLVATSRLPHPKKKEIKLDSWQLPGRDERKTVEGLLNLNRNDPLTSYGVSAGYQRTTNYSQQSWGREQQEPQNWLNALDGSTQYTHGHQRREGEAIR